MRHTSWPRCALASAAPAFPGALPGRGAGPGSAAFKPLPPDSPRAGPPCRSLALPRALLASYWRGAAVPPPPSRGRLRSGRCCGLRLRAVRARHGAAAAAASPAAAALPRLAAPPGETRGGCLRPKSRSGERLSCSRLARREGRERGRAASALPARGEAWGHYPDTAARAALFALK